MNVNGPVMKMFFNALLLLTATSASADLNVKFDCYLPSGPVDCQSLRTSYFSTMTFLKAVDDDKNAYLTVQVRTLPADPRSVRYILVFNGAGEAPDFSLIEDIPTTISSDAILQKVLINLQKGTGPYLSVEQMGQTGEDGLFVLKYSIPGDKKNTRPTTGWYQNTSISGNVSSGDSDYINGSLSTGVNYSDPSWRFKAGASANYQKITVRYGGNEENLEVVSFNGKTLIARTVDKGWSVAALVRAGYEPAGNLDFNGEAGVGLAWDLVPFMKGNDNSFGVKYLVGVTHQNYVDPNVLDEMSKTFVAHGAELYFSWHFDRLDLTAGLGASSIINDYRFARVGGSMGATWRITDRLNASLSFDAGYRRAIINAPKEENAENGLEQFFAGGNYANFTYSTMLSLGYIFGNSALDRQDQRWKGF